MEQLTTKDKKQTFVRKENYEFAYRRKKIRMTWDYEFDGYRVAWLANNKENHVGYMNFKQIIEIYEWVINLSKNNFTVTKLD